MEHQATWYSPITQHLNMYNLETDIFDEELWTLGSADQRKALLMH